MRPFGRSLCLLAAAASAAAAQQDQAGGRPRLALLVGVQHYELPADPEQMVPAPLGGVHDDIRSVAITLRRHHGFAGDDIEVLLDRDATHQRVVERFRRHLIEKADASTCAVFWFCGHGSRVPDRSGRESNKGMLEDHGLEGAFDGSLVLFDSRSDQAANRDLVDDELYSLVRVLAQRARQVVVVTDSCHSGDVTRGQPTATARFQPPDPRPWDGDFVRTIWPHDIPLLDDDDPLREADAVAGLRYVHIAASGNAQLAYERQLPSGRRAGALTHHLTNVLRGQRPRSWREAALRARALVAAEFPQTVCFEGDLDQPLFDGTARELPSGHVAAIERDGNVQVEAGRLHGLGPGSVLELVDLDGKPVGRALAVVVGATSASCRLDGGDPAVLADRALVARLLDRPTGRVPLRLRPLPGVAADLLAKSHHAVFDGDGADGALGPGPDGSLQLIDPAGYVARSLPPHRDALDEALRKEHAYRTLRELVAAVAPLQLALQVVPTRPEVLSGLTEPAPAANWQPLPDGRTAVRAPFLEPTTGGGVLTIRVENRSSKPLHVTLLSVVEDRSVEIVWPGEGQRDRIVRPGTTVDAVVLVGPNRRWPLQRPMVDRYLAIATQAHADFRPFRSGSTLAEGTAAATRGSDPGRLPGILELALHGQRTRGGDRGSAADEEPYGVAWLDLVLLPQQR